MLKLLRRTCLRVTAHRSAGGRRSRRLGVLFESLESRNMLSASPLAVEYYSTIGSISDVSLVGSMVAGAEADEGEEYEQQKGSWVSIGGGEMDRRDMDSIRTKPDYETWLPNLPPAKGGLGGEYGLPPVVRDPMPQDPPPAAPGGSPAGGLIDLAELGHTTPQTSPAPMFETRADREAREVQAMLSTLKYVPDASRDTTSESPATLQNNAARPQASGDQAFLDWSQGGMVTLGRETVIRRAEAGKINTASEADSPLNVPVEMDSARGKFQAFEISTLEESPQRVPANAPPAAAGARAIQPMTFSSELTIGPVFVSIPAPTALAEAAADGVAIVAESAEHSAKPAEPVASHEPANPSWSAAAAAFFLALAARAAWPAAVRRPHDDSAPAGYAHPDRKTASRVRTLSVGHDPLATIRID